MSGQVRVLWCLVNYGTAELVARFAHDMHRGGSVRSKLDVRVAVAENTQPAELEPAHLPPISTFVHCPENPGYLPGALLAYQGALESDPDWEPEWIVVSNADLEVPDVFWEWIQVEEADGRRCFAPQVYCEARENTLNPHLRSRPSVPYLASRWVFTRSRTLRRVMSLVAGWRRKHPARGSATVTPAGTDGRFALSEPVYACHGTVHVLPGKAMRELVPQLIDCPLYAEELAFAEAFRRSGLGLHVVEGVLFRHRPHASTGQQDEETWVGRWRTAYDYMLRLRLRDIRR